MSKFLDYSGLQYLIGKLDLITPNWAPNLLTRIPLYLGYWPTNHSGFKSNESGVIQVLNNSLLYVGDSTKKATIDTENNPLLYPMITGNYYTVDVKVLEPYSSSGIYLSAAGEQSYTPLLQNVAKHCTLTFKCNDQNQLILIWGSNHVYRILLLQITKTKCPVPYNAFGAQIGYLIDDKISEI